MSGRATSVWAAAVVLGLLALVAVASGSDRAGAGGDSSWLPPVGVLDYAYTAGVLLVVATLLVVLGVRRPSVAARSGFGIAQLLAFTLVVGALTAVAYRAQTLNADEIRARGERVREAARALEERTAEPKGEPRDIRFRWELAAVAAALTAAAVAAASVLRRHRARRLPPRVEREVALALDESLEDLRREPDARRAVIAAYARLERTLAAHGLERRPADAPLEYLARMLGALRVRPDAALTLTELFERAKFSRHVIDADMRDEAVDALVAVRDDLERAA